MAATETPPSPPENPPEPQLDRLPGRYDSRSPRELLDVIDDLEGSRFSARVREAIWVSLILHLVVFWWIFYGPRPKIFRSATVVNPIPVNPKKPPQQVYLTMPPNLPVQKPKKPTNIIADQNHVAQTKHPTLDQKTLQELEAMRRAGRPSPAPQPQQRAQAPQRPSPQMQAHMTPPAPPQPQPVPESALPAAPSANLNAPDKRREAQHKSKTQAQQRADNQPAMSVGEMIRRAERNAIRSNGGQNGDNGQNAPLAHPGVQSGIDVLSDTRGVDFGPYLRKVHDATQASWDLLIPESARAPLLKSGKVAIQFIILPDGSVKDMQLVLPSGDVSLDRAAWGGITGASPYPPLPKAFKGPYLALRFYFLYNEQTGQFTPASQ